MAGLVLDTNSVFYGTTFRGGTNDAGTAFKMASDGTLTNLFYGSGTYGNGTIFSITPVGAQATLYTFSGGDGSSPTAGLVQGADGNFYGTTEYGGTGGSGTMFQMSPSGAFTSLFSFGINGTNNGASPDAEMAQSSGSGFYGTTSSGGSLGGGNIVQIGRTAPFILPAPQTAGALTFTWTAVPGQSYQVQYATDLAQPVWNNLGGVVTATNITMTTVDSAPPDPQRFYQVILQ
jgi:uncharacterized repeat protein (TIGR03803 family)